jgi:hypothetical protein
LVRFTKASWLELKNMRTPRPVVSDPFDVSYTRVKDTAAPPGAADWLMGSGTTICCCPDAAAASARATTTSATVPVYLKVMV